MPTEAPCGVRWRDDWQCQDDPTGLHTCRVVGEHHWHRCDASQESTNPRLAAGSVCADGHPSSIEPGRTHHHPLPDGSSCTPKEAR